MQIDKFIAELTKLRQTYGPNIEVMQLAVGSRSVSKASLPRIAHTKADNPRALFSVVNDLDRNKGLRIVVLGLGEAKVREERKVAKRLGAV